MKLSTISRYGYRATIELAKHHNGKAISLKKIARAQDIPLRYLENIMMRLVNAHIVESTRGREGGFKLAKDPAQITIYDIVDALENTLTPIPCIDNPNTCKRYTICGARDFLNEAYEAFVRVLKSHTLREAANLELNKESIEKRRIR